MFKGRFRKLVIAGVLIAAYFGFQNWKHKNDRPWAYADGPLLPGKWEGQFPDPNGLTKNISLEIFEPEVKNYPPGYKGKRYDASNEFKGIARVESRIGTENHRITGKLDPGDCHKINFVSFTPIDEKKQIPESFNVSHAEKGGTWKGDTVRVSIAFTYRTKNGASYTSNTDRRFSTKTPIILHRLKN